MRRRCKVNKRAVCAVIEQAHREGVTSAVVARLLGIRADYYRRLIVEFGYAKTGIPSPELRALIDQARRLPVDEKTLLVP